MKIAINAGHTLRGRGTGAVGYLNEMKENRKIAQRVTQLLKEVGHEVVDCTIDESSNDLKEAVVRANNANVDLFCSIHLNAGGGRGTETYVYRKGGKAEEFAKDINPLVVKSCGFTNRGIKEVNFYVLKYTAAPAVLIEVCFVDSKEDAQKLNTALVSKAIAEGITKRVFLEMYRVRKTWEDEKSQLGAYRGLENAISMAKKNKGYSVFNSRGECIF